MKERPILMSAPMVRAVLSGAKTQTRRIIKRKASDVTDAYRSPALCPYGRIGDQLWVRESFMHTPAEYEPMMSMTHPLVPAETFYMADHHGDARGLGWKPSIYLPRNLSRITLEITDVRVELLQSISEADGVAEGIRISSAARGSDACYGIYECQMPDGKTHFNDSAYALYRTLWEQINGSASWSANPWVWVVQFRMV